MSLAASKGYAVCISGATGIVARRVNGLYEVTDEVFGGMPVYKKQGGEMWLEYHDSHGNWMLRVIEHKGEAESVCTAYVDCDVGLLPDKAPRGAWHVWVEKDIFEAQAGIAVTQKSAAEVAVLQAALQAAFAAARVATKAEARVAKVRKSGD